MALGNRAALLSTLLLAPGTAPTPCPQPRLTAATRLFSVMKVTARRGRVSVHREATLRGRAGHC